ncbi:ArnT family glycosyltransferase [Fulvivirga lutea]|uniref:Glycosyltransferase family 39 protein n=1 Tax=Fulvivirga lutea TaxID=2810512 RepID=A0A974WHJ5_9BACT|nr:glycosyltransferase family 39 protein [Fulvivirga lutea]QSE96230.1 glycosyltransferase family 39 protein [Fulvivirga lutea]
MTINQRVQEYYAQYPFKTILIVAVIARLLAALFSEGYAFHDDHFDVTRVAQSWANGIPHWLETGIPPKHSMFYAGINAGFIWVVELFGASDPYVKTTFLRIIHALYSVLIVVFGYRLALLLSDEKKAKLVGWILALLWFFPFMGVRFLVEMVCIPPIMIGFYYLIKNLRQEIRSTVPWVLAGLLFGLAFAFRYHTILFAGGLGLVLLYRKEWTGSVLFTLGYLIAAFLTVGMIDIIFFDYPFHSIVEYFAYNSSNANNFISGSPFKFTLTTFGFLIPPISVFLMIGFIRSYKVEPLIFVAVLVFFVFHSAFPNQQERFILPMFPLLVVMGTIGWKSWADSSDFWSKYKIIPSISWKFFWTVNIIGGLFMSFTFSKKDRVAPLHYLSQKQDVEAVLIENEKSVKQPPVYYLGENSSDYNEWDKGILGLTKEEKLADDHKVVFSFDPRKTKGELLDEFSDAQKRPNYVIFQGVKELEARKDMVKSIFSGKQLTFEKEIKPSALDRLLHFFNPRIHRDQTANIYKIN